MVVEGIAWMLREAFCVSDHSRGVALAGKLAASCI